MVAKLVGASSTSYMIYRLRFNVRCKLVFKTFRIRINVFYWKHSANAKCKRFTDTSRVRLMSESSEFTEIIDLDFKGAMLRYLLSVKQLKLI